MCARRATPRLEMLPHLRQVTVRWVDLRRLMRTLAVLPGARYAPQDLQKQRFM